MKRDLDLVPAFQWMIQRKPADLSEGDFDLIMDGLGGDPRQAERFINVFSHAVSSSEFFGRLHASSLLGREPASFDTRQLHSGRQNADGH
jgi:hypothetical protein